MASIRRRTERLLVREGLLDRRDDSYGLISDGAATQKRLDDLDRRVGGSSFAQMGASSLLSTPALLIAALLLLDERVLAARRR